MCMRIFLWRARRRFTFQIGNRARMRQIKVSVVARARVNKSERTKLHTARSHVPAFAFAREARAAFYTYNFIYDAENGGEKEVHRRTPRALLAAPHIFLDYLQNVL